MNRVWQLPFALLLGFLCLASTAFTAAAQESFRWHFEEGQELSLVLEGKIEVSNQPGSGDFPMYTSWSYYFTWQIASVDEAGTATVTQTIERVATGVGFGDFKDEFDTADEQANPEHHMADIMPAIIGKPMTLTISSRGEILSVESSAEASEAFEPIADTAFGLDSIRFFLEKGLITFPEEAVAEGDSWSTTNTFGPDEIETTLEFTYRGLADYEDRQVATFERTASMSPGTVVGGTRTEDDQGIVEETTHEMGEQTSEGLIRFDPATGLMLQSELVHQFQEMHEDEVLSDIRMSVEATLTPRQGE